MKKAIREALKNRLEEAKELKGGTWLTKLIKKLLEHHAKKVNAQYFIKKYPGLDRERIAHRLIQSSAQAAGISGASAAAAISAAELGAVETGGATLAVAISSFAAEVSGTTYIQLKLVYDISVVLDVALDLDDPEDVMAMFWYALGINIWEEMANAFMTAGPRSAAYLGRKALRAGIRKAAQKVLARFGGQKLAQRLTEKAVLRLAVPGVNMPVAYFVNKAFTKHLGRTTIKRLKHRRAAIQPLTRLLRAERICQLFALPTIFHLGIYDEAKEIRSLVVEMLDTVNRRLRIQEEEEPIVEELIEMSFSEFLVRVGRLQDATAKEPLIDLAFYAHVFSDAGDANGSKLRGFVEVLGEPFDKTRVAKLAKDFNL